MRVPILAAVVIVSGCSVQPNPVDLVLVGGAVWTGQGQQTVEALAVRSGRIVEMGSSEHIRDYAGPDTRVVELEGRLVVPGFIDSHVHFLSGGMQLASVDLRDAGTPEEFARRLGGFTATQEEGDWITGGDWDHERWPGSPLPDREWIDPVTGSNPVFVTRLDGHMGLANTRALELAGITADTPDPPGGTIVRDAAGRATGVLKDEAMNLIREVVPEPSDRELDQAFRRAQSHALSRGVTMVHDMGDWPSLATYERAYERGELNMRIYAFVPIATWQRLRDRVHARGIGDMRLSWGGVKGFVDGSLGSTTAWFYEPYLDEPGSVGLMVTDTSELRAAILGADAARLQVAVHAIGDRANDWLLDVYAEAAARRERDRRFRVEHAQHLTREAIARFGQQRVIPSMQPYHAADDGRWAEDRIGPERARTTYAFRSLIDAGARPAFGSDWTVAPIDPLLGIEAAVTRQTLDGEHPDGWVPEQRIGVEEALTAYTRNSAYAGRVENELGVLRPGRLADMVVLSRNILEIAPDQIGETEVDMTIIDGLVLYDRER